MESRLIEAKLNIRASQSHNMPRRAVGISNALETGFLGEGLHGGYYYMFIMNVTNVDGMRITLLDLMARYTVPF